MHEPWTAPLAQRVAQVADVQQITTAIISVWLEIERALSPILGRRGVAALYRRSLNLCVDLHPWLQAAQPPALADFDTSALATALLQQTPGNAGQGGVALLEALHALMCSLVGTSLTDRLLQPVWAHTLGPAPKQDSAS